MFIWYVSKNEISDINWLKMLGYKDNQLSTALETWKNILHPADKSRVLSIIDDFACGKIDSFNISYRLRSNDFKWSQIIDRSIAIEFNSDKTPYKAVRTFCVENMENDVRNSAVFIERIHDIFNTLPIGIHLYNLEDDGRLIFLGANTTADSILGVDNSRFIGLTIEEAFPPLKETEIPYNYKKTALSGEIYENTTIEYDHDDISGAFYVKTFQPYPRQVAAMFIDITAQKKSEAIVKITNERTASLLRMSQLHNNTMNDLINCGLDELIRLTNSKNSFIVIPGNDFKTVTVYSKSISTTKNKSKVNKLKIKTNKFTIFDRIFRQKKSDVLNSYDESNPFNNQTEKLNLPKKRHVIVPILDGNNVGIISGAGDRNVQYGKRDINQLNYIMIAFLKLFQKKTAEDKLVLLNKELEKRVHDRTKQLEMLNKELETFAYTVSHDLRTPLRAIDGFSMAIIDEFKNNLDDKAVSYFERIRSASQKMSEFIDGILIISKVVRQDLVFNEVNISSMVKNILENLQKSYPDKKFVFQIQPDLTANCDKNTIYILLKNLLENALKFSAKKPDAKIEFGKTKIDNEYVFFVRDNGAGFDMAYYDKLFLPFSRLHSLHDFAGNGIGLATVLRIIKRHKGEIWAESTVGEGTTFYFTINS